MLLALFGFILANSISESEFGVFSHAEAIVAILSVFSLQGLDQLVQRELIQRNFSEGEIFGTCLILKLLIAVIVLVLFYILIPIIYEPSLLLWLIFILINNNVFRTFHFFSSLLICEDKYIKYSIIGITSATISFVVKLIVLEYFNNFYSIAFSMIIESGLLFIFYIALYTKYRTGKLGFSKPFLRVLYSEGRYLILSGVIIILYTKIDLVMIGNFLSNNDVAEYSLSTKVITLFLIVGSVFNLGYVSKLNVNSSHYARICREMILLTFVLGISITLFSYIFSPLLLNAFFPNKYINAQDYVMALSPVIFFGFLLSTTGRILIVEGLAYVGFMRNLLALIANVILNYHYIPLYGVYGAIFSSIISYIISSFIYLFLDKKSRTVIFKVFTR